MEILTKFFLTCLITIVASGFAWALFSVLGIDQKYRLANKALIYLFWVSTAGLIFTGIFSVWFS